MKSRAPANARTELTTVAPLSTQILPGGTSTLV